MRGIIYWIGGVLSRPVDSVWSAVLCGVLCYVGTLVGIKAGLWTGQLTARKCRIKDVAATLVMASRSTYDVECGCGHTGDCHGCLHPDCDDCEADECLVTGCECDHLHDCKYLWRQHLSARWEGAKSVVKYAAVRDGFWWNWLADWRYRAYRVRQIVRGDEPSCWRKEGPTHERV